MWIIMAIFIGIIIGIILPYDIPLVYAKYVSVSFLAGMDSVLGGVRANMEGKFNFTVFSTGFVANALLAALLTFVGDRLGVDLYLAAIVTFGVRIFQNFAIIRRDLIQGRCNINKDKKNVAENI
ncbi:MAG: small basic family protein [Candidatus Eremiobacteraeota bacterium]|nr:small basic family protein [Candidatus Eremiobacteraeota bacterium]